MDYKYPTPQLLLKAICDAIRSKTNSTDKILHQNISDELDNIIVNINEEEYNIEMQRFIDIIEGTSFINDRITTVKSKLFDHCSGLTTIDLPKCTSIKSVAFNNCTSLTTIDLPKCTSIGEYAFAYCENLTTVNLPKCTSIGEYAFDHCSGLTTIDLPKCTSIEYYAFDNCTSLTTIIFSANQVVYICRNAFISSPIGRGTGYVYVPDNLVNSYKSDTDWSTYANQIKPISSLPSNLKEEYGYV